MTDQPLTDPLADPVDLLRLASADNFRDIAGPHGAPAYGTSDGGRIRRGVFYRSNELRLSVEDHSALSGLGLDAILDLRSHTEIAMHPDPELPGTDWLHFDVLGIPLERMSSLNSRNEAVGLMEEVYDGFVREDDSRAALGSLLRQLATGGRQLFHCTAGKDRTGWTAALLLHIGGVDDPTIASDYLLTNALTSASRARTEAAISEHLGPDGVRVLEPTLIVDASYLQTALSAVSELYGDRATYLHDGLGLDETTVGTLRGLLREG